MEGNRVGVSPVSKIHFMSTAEIHLDVTSISVLLMNSGKHPSIKPKDMQLYGYREQVTFADGVVEPGIIEPVNIWYIEHPSGCKILVDTGYTPSLVETVNELMLVRGQGQFTVSDEQHDITRFLEERGTRPEDIDYVVLTHMHIDHCMNLAAFPNAKIMVQRSEIPWGLAPPPYASFHWAELTPNLTPHVNRFIAVDGDAQLLPGVSLWHVGGHTPGSMAVAVETSRGTTVIAGDFYVAQQNIDFGWPPGALSSITEWERSDRHIKSHADLILPSHDYHTYTLFPDGAID